MNSSDQIFSEVHDILFFSHEILLNPFSVEAEIKLTCFGKTISLLEKMAFARDKYGQHAQQPEENSIQDIQSGEENPDELKFPKIKKGQTKRQVIW